MSAPTPDVAVERFKEYLRIKTVHVRTCLSFATMLLQWMYTHATQRGRPVSHAWAPGLGLPFMCVQPTPDYPAAVAFLERYAAEVGLPVETIEISTGRTIVLMTWLGSQPELPSLVLNSHTDVVPVYPGVFVRVVAGAGGGGDRASAPHHLPGTMSVLSPLGRGRHLCVRAASTRWSPLWGWAGKLLVGSKWAELRRRRIGSAPPPPRS